MLRDKAGNNRIHLSADAAQLFLGARGQDGNLIVRDRNGRNRVFNNGDRGQLFLGTDGQDGNLIVRNNAGETTVFINGDAGDITRQNADFAEDFDLAAEIEAVPGTVMRIGPDGALEACDRHADPRAVGVVSGAGGTRPELVLDHDGARTGRAPVGLVGKVGVFVDPDRPALAPGDPMTSSARPGCATRAEPDTPADAILGRMLRPFAEDMVIMLVRN